MIYFNLKVFSLIHADLQAKAKNLDSPAKCWLLDIVIMSLRLCCGSGTSGIFV